jgi:hypothetical protein
MQDSPERTESDASLERKAKQYVSEDEDSDDLEDSDVDLDPTTALTLEPPPSAEPTAPNYKINWVYNIHPVL